jgi:hypothetical protein
MPRTSFNLSPSITKPGRAGQVTNEPTFFGRLKQPNLAVLDQVEHLFRGHDFRTITGCFKYDITKEELHV